MRDRPTVYQSTAIADGLSASLRTNMTLIVSGDRIEWIGPDSLAPPAATHYRVVDASGATVIPGLVDSHCHVSLPGGARFMERGFDSRAELTANADENGRLAKSVGVRWMRDVGSPQRRTDSGHHRASALSVRDAWASRREMPTLRASGTWASPVGFLPPGFAVDVSDGDELMRAAVAQLEQGADHIKLMLDGPEKDVCPWTVEEVSAVVDLGRRHGRGTAAHATCLAGVRVGVEAGVESIEHGTEIDADAAELMKAKGTVLVSTLCVYRSWQGFASTTEMSRYTSTLGVTRAQELYEKSCESVSRAYAAGVPIAAGTDSGGGSTRANHLPWEVECLVDAGLPPQDALAAATWRGGDLLGEPSAGRLREGGPADFFFVHGNPLDEPQALWRVWKIV
jgi:imidazolonepropionase-like amidohydrolase